MAITGVEQESKVLANPTEKDVESSTPQSTPAPSELEPVVTFKTWIVVCVRACNRPRTDISLTMHHSVPVLWIWLMFLACTYGSGCRDSCFGRLRAAQCLRLVCAGVDDFGNCLVHDRRSKHGHPGPTLVPRGRQSRKSPLLTLARSALTYCKLCVVGHLIAGASKQTGNPNMITAGMALTGFGGGFCQVRLPCMAPTCK